MNVSKFRSLSPKFQNSKFSDKYKLIGDEWTFWELLESYAITFTDNVIPRFPDITCRGFGSQRQCFTLTGDFPKIGTNTEIMPNSKLQNLQYVASQSYFATVNDNSRSRTTTNIENQTDVFVMWKALDSSPGANKDAIIVTQIDP